MTSTLTAILLELLKIDSPTENEENITEFIQTFSKDIPNLQLTTNGKTLVYSFHKAKELKTLALYGHTDTVHNQQDKAPYTDEKYIYGCGASDMKSGLAVMLKLMLKLNDSLSRFNLQFIFYDGEEGPYEKSGLGPALLKIPQLKQADLALVLEPTLNTIQNGCLGVMNIKLSFLGKSSHSARPWEGENPITKALPLLNKIAAYRPQKFTFAKLDFYETIAITKLNAGLQKNIIPPELQANLNYRFAPARSLTTAKTFILNFLGTSAAIDIIDSAPASKVIANNVLLSEFIAKNNLALMPKQAWTDIARLNEAAIPAVNFGPGDPAAAHQKNEWASLSKLQEAYQMLASFIFNSK